MITDRVLCHVQASIQGKALIYIIIILVLTVSYIIWPLYYNHLYSHKVGHIDIHDIHTNIINTKVSLSVTLLWLNNLTNFVKIRLRQSWGLKIKYELFKKISLLASEIEWKLLWKILLMTFCFYNWGIT